MKQRRRASESLTVLCSRCGRSLRGNPNLAGKFVIRKHKRPNGFNCDGHLLIDHARQIGGAR